MITTLTARRLLTGTVAINYPIIEVEEGSIVSIASGRENGCLQTLAPAFFDVHVHGARSHDFMTADLPGIESIGRYLASRGVANYLATTVTGPVEATLRALERLALAIEAGPTAGVARTVGIHLEGPFVSHARRGVHPATCLLEPSVAMFDRFQEAARGNIRLLTIAPELPGAFELISHAAVSGVRVSLGHSDADEAKTLAGIAAGATSATHCFNAMRSIGHREPGIAGTVLDQRELYAELICDGVHVAPAMIRMWLALKGLERGILVTDGMSATGMPDGEYMLGELPVQVHHGVCRLGGLLAGSVLTMDQALANLRRFTGASLLEAVGLASTNPARMLGMEELAVVRVGGAASFSLYDESDKFSGAILAGHRI